MNSKEIKNNTILGVIIANKTDYLFTVSKSEFISTYNFNTNTNSKLFLIKKIELISENEPTENIVRIKNFIERYNFYYSDMVEDEYVWNLSMIEKLKKSEYMKNFDILKHRYVYMYAGYTNSIYNGGYCSIIISLINTKKIGPRLFCRGADQNGNVSFFVKTVYAITKILHKSINKKTINTDKSINNQHSNIFRIEMYRGSIPLIWKQSLTRITINPDSIDVFKNHFKKLPENVVVINLLKKDDDLTIFYESFLEKHKIKYFTFDLNKYKNDYKKMRINFHSALDEFFNRNPDILNNPKNSIKKFLSDDYFDVSKFVTFRINCLDCLDRTNIAQYLIADYFINMNYDYYTSSQLKKLFFDNGNVLSHFYSGSNALRGELLKGKRSVIGRIEDMMCVLTRTINFKLTDKIKKQIIDDILDKNLTDVNKDLKNLFIENKKQFENLTMDEKRNEDKKINDNLKSFNSKSEIHDTNQENKNVNQNIFKINDKNTLGIFVMTVFNSDEFNNLNIEINTKYLIIVINKLTRVIKYLELKINNVFKNYKIIENMNKGDVNYFFCVKTDFKSKINNIKEDIKNKSEEYLLNNEYNFNTESLLNKKSEFSMLRFKTSCIEHLFSIKDKKIRILVGNFENDHINYLINYLKDKKQDKLLILGCFIYENNNNLKMKITYKNYKINGYLNNKIYYENIDLLESEEIILENVFSYPLISIFKL